MDHARKEVLGSAALVGSSNFTFPGLTENIELNVQITGGPALQEYFKGHEMSVGEWGLAGPEKGGSHMYRAT